MAGTFSQLYVQLVFGVKGRESLIDPTWEEKLFKYISGIVANKGQKLMAINGMPDHIHILVSISPNCRLSDLVREIKKSSNEFVNRNKFSYSHFQWQSGYGVFSYSQSCIEKIVQYILNQKEHHKKSDFNIEYKKLLNRFKINADVDYLFEKIQ